MPNYYAHLTFGQRVLADLPAGLSELIEQEREAFDLGCLGPDPLFFYQPIRPNADGVRELAGILTGREGTTVTLDTDNGPVAFEVNAASSVQLCDDEDLFD